MIRHAIINHEDLCLYAGSKRDDQFLSRTNILCDWLWVSACVRAAVTVTPKTNKKSEGCRKSTARLVVEGNSSRCLCFMSFSMSIPVVCLCVNLRVLVRLLWKCLFGFPFRVSLSLWFEISRLAFSRVLARKESFPSRQKIHGLDHPGWS